MEYGVQPTTLAVFFISIRSPTLTTANIQRWLLTMAPPGDGRFGSVSVIIVEQQRNTINYLSVVERQPDSECRALSQMFGVDHLRTEDVTPRATGDIGDSGCHGTHSKPSQAYFNAHAMHCFNSTSAYKWVGEQRYSRYLAVNEIIMSLATATSSEIQQNADVSLFRPPPATCFPACIFAF